MMQRALAAALTGVLVIGLSACTTINVNATVADGIDFDNYRTFAQAPPVESARPAGVGGYSSITEDNIQREIALNLEAKGLSKTSVDNADIVVRFSTSGKPQTDVWGGGGWGYYGGGTVTTTHYVQGTLVIDIFDANKRKLVWHGWGTAKIFESDASGKLVPRAVEKILKQYPPR